jgi:hypothetical protein
VKYTSQAYLEAVPGLFALLAVLAFERARRGASGAGQGAPFQLVPLALSGALLGLTAAGKYPYGMVAGLAFLPFLLWYARARGRVWAAFVLRYDLAERSPEYVKELAAHHVGGQLSVAPRPHAASSPRAVSTRSGGRAEKRLLARAPVLHSGGRWTYGTCPGPLPPWVT